MKTKDPPRKRRTSAARLWLFLFFAGAFFMLSFLSASLFITRDISPSLDDALFRKAGSDPVTHLYYREGDGFVEWEAERVFTGGFCLYAAKDEIPQSVKNAFVAMEDHRFYRHGGVDVLRTAKAAFNRLFGGSRSFGGSTITQQLIKNIGGEREKTAVRKIREMTRALSLETRYGKEEILEAYLNIVPMGEGCIGVGAAAERYFGKSISELSLAEAASLAAITPAPARLNPRASAEDNVARRNRVLARMAELGYISEDECRAAQGEALSLAQYKEEKSVARSWYAERVLEEVKAGLVAKGYTESAANALIYGGGLHIYTALDPAAQKAAEEAFRDNSLYERYGEGFHAGGVVFSPESGKLVALVGDLGQKKDSRIFSYATDMRRAPGSALKPIALYATAIDEGLITEATLFDDVPKSFTSAGAWPHNTPDAFDGLILAKDALIKSKNTVAVDLYRRMGAEHIYASLRDRFRIDGLVRRTEDANGDVRTDLAEAPLALGELTRGVSLFALARAYLPFCMRGEITEGSTLLRVEDDKGTVLIDASQENSRAITPMTASVMTHMLSGVAEEGSAKTLTLKETVDTAGKTGSSGGNRDRWFVGYTPYYLCGIWCGYAEGGKAVDGTPHLSLFDAVMKPLHASIDADVLKGFEKDPALVCVNVCMDSGKTPTILCKEDARGVRETTVWIPASVHLGMCDTHVSVFYDPENEGVAYPPQKGREGALVRVSLLNIPWRAFPREVRVTDAEYVYRDPKGCGVAEGNVPFFAGAIPDGVYIGKSHDGRPYHAAARTPSEAPPVSREKKETIPKRKEPKKENKKAPFRLRLPFRIPFFGRFLK